MGPPLAGSAVLLLLAASAGGCIDAWTTSDGGGVEEEGPSPILAGGPASLVLTDCVGLRTFAYPVGVIGPADRPSGWPASPMPDLPNVVVQALRCSRINV